MKLFRSVASVSILAAVLTACGGGSSANSEPATNGSAVNTETAAVASTPEGPTTTVSDDVAKIRVTVGVNSGPDRIENVKLNQQVELTIVNPKADDEFHLHGYDLGGGLTKAGEAKIEMLAEATKDARARAEQIASQGGRTVKELRAAKMGVFQITPLYSGRASSNWEGENDMSSLEKNISAVVNATFSMN